MSRRRQGDMGTLAISILSSDFVRAKPRPLGKMFYFYVLQKKGKYNDVYFGYTKDLKRRTAEHMRDDNNWKLIYYEAYTSDENARNREKKIEYYGSVWRALKKRIGA